MASKDFYTDIDLLNASQLKGARIYNVTTAQRTSLGTTLTGANEGLIVWDTDLKYQYWWDGSKWVQGIQPIQGAMVYKGSFSDAVNKPTAPEAGFVYVWNGGDATLTWAGQTFNPDAKVQNGDQIVYRGSDVWDVYQADLNPASTTEAGYVRLATRTETVTGTSDSIAVTPDGLNNYAQTKAFAKTYFNSAFSTTAATPLTVTHNLGLQHKNAFVAAVYDSTGSEVEVDIDGVSTNAITVTTVIPLVNGIITIIGF